MKKAEELHHLKEEVRLKFNLYPRRFRGDIGVCLLCRIAAVNFTWCRRATDRRIERAKGGKRGGEEKSYMFSLDS